MVFRIWGALGGYATDYRRKIALTMLPASLTALFSNFALYCLTLTAALAGVVLLPFARVNGGALFGRYAQNSK